MNYEYLVHEAFENGINVNEFTLKGKFKGLYADDTIIINSKLNESNKYCTLAEELGHYWTTVGDILDLNITNNRKQELKARNWAIEKILHINELKECLIKTNYLCDIAEHFNVTIEFLIEGIEYYKVKGKIE